MILFFLITLADLCISNLVPVETGDSLSVGLWATYQYTLILKVF